MSPNTIVPSTEDYPAAAVVPEPRVFHAAVHLPGHDVMVVVGGPGRGGHLGTSSVLVYRYVRVFKV